MTWAILKAEFRVLRRTVWPEFIGRSLAPMLSFILFPMIAFIHNRHGIQLTDFADSTWNQVQGPLAGTVLLGSLISPTLMAFNYRNSPYPLTLRGFSRPVPAYFLVLLPLLWISALTVLCYVFWAGVGRLFLQIAMPILLVIPFLVFTTAVLAYVAWSRGHYTLRTGVLGMFFLVSFTWFVPNFFGATHWLGELAPGKVVIGGTGWANLGMLLGVIPLYWLTVDNIRRQRCGELPGSADRIRTYLDRFERTPETIGPFSSAKSAQWWFEERRVLGKFTVALGVGLVFLLGGSWSLSAAGFSDAIESFLILGKGYITIIITVLAISTILGVSATKNGRQLSNFDMIQPRTVGDIVWHRFLVAITLTLISFASIWGWAYFCQKVFAWASGEYSFLNVAILGREITTASIGLTGIVVAHATIGCASLVLVLMNAGYQFAKSQRRQITSTVVFAFSGAVLSLKVMGAELLGLDQLVMFYWGAWAVGTTVLGLRDSVQAGYFSIRQLSIAVIGWIMLLLLTGWLARDAELDLLSMGSGELILLMGVLCVPIGAMVWAPLSLAAARHR